MPIKGQCNFCLVCLSCYVHVLLLVVISLLVDMVDVNLVDDTCSWFPSLSYCLSYVSCITISLLNMFIVYPNDKLIFNLFWTLDRLRQNVGILVTNIFSHSLPKVCCTSNYSCANQRTWYASKFISIFVNAIKERQSFLAFIFFLLLFETGKRSQKLLERLLQNQWDWRLHRSHALLWHC